MSKTWLDLGRSEKGSSQMNEDDTYNALMKLTFVEADRVWENLGYDGKSKLECDKFKKEFFAKTGWTVREFWNEWSNRQTRMYGRR